MLPTFFSLPCSTLGALENKIWAENMEYFVKKYPSQSMFLFPSQVGVQICLHNYIHMCIYYHKYLEWTGKEKVVSPCLVFSANIEIYFGNHRVLFAKSLVVVCKIFVGVPPRGRREDESREQIPAFNISQCHNWNLGFQEFAIKET